MLETAIEESRSAGRVVVVAGEAGIGKTALVSALADRHRVLWGACDPLITPRPMGPLRDVARQAGGALAEAVEGSREDLLSAVLDELRAPAALVIEDLHWADDATLDFVALLGRRLPRSRGCLVVTCRPDVRDEVRRVLAALPRECVRTVEPGALSEQAVALLARRAGRDAADLHATSGGNPFFVTEVLAAPAGDGVPASVRDAVALRAAAAGEEANAVAELAAVFPGPAELALVTALAGADAGAVDRCVEAGLLYLRGDALAFRHDLARRAVEDALSPLRRRELNAQRARGAGGGRRGRHGAARAPRPPRRRRGGDPPAGARGGPRGGRRRRPPAGARALGGRAGGDGRRRRRGARGRRRSRPTTARASTARSRRAARCSSSTRPRATAARGRRPALARAAPVVGGRRRGRAAGDRCGRSRARGVPGQSRARHGAQRDARSSRCSSERHDEAIELGMRAERLARGDRRPGDRRPCADQRRHDATCSENRNGRGRALLDEAFSLASEAGYDDHAARALVNIATSVLTRRPDDPSVAATSSARCGSRAAATSTATSSICSACARTCCASAGGGTQAEADARRLTGARRAHRREPLPGADRARPAPGQAR